MGAADEYLKIRAEWDGRQVSNGVGWLDSRMGQLRSKIAALPPLARQAGAALIAGFGVGLSKEILDRTAEVARLGSQMDITEQAFYGLADRMGSDGQQELQRLRSAVGGTMTDLELMSTVGAGVESGLTFDQSVVTLEYLRRYALAYQKDFHQLTSTLFTGLSRGSTLMLDDAAIVIDASADIYKGLSDVEKKSALVETAIEMMGEKMKTLPEIGSNAVTEMDRLRTEWDNLIAAVGQEIDNPFAALPSFLSSALREIRHRIQAESFIAPEYSSAKIITPPKEPRKPLATIEYRTPVRDPGVEPPRLHTDSASYSSTTLSFAPNAPRIADPAGNKFDLAELLRAYVQDVQPTVRSPAFTPSIDHLKPRAEGRNDPIADTLADVDKWASEVQRYQHETAVLAARTADDLIAQEKLAYDLRVKTAQQTAQALGLSEGDTRARLEALAGEHQKNLAGIAEEGASEVQRYQHETAVLAARTADDLVAQEKLAYDLRVKTAQQTAQALGLSEGDTYARLEALADEHQKNLAGIAEEMEKASEPTSTLTSDLSLLSQNMSRLHPVVGAFIGQINNIIQAASTFQNASSSLGKIAGAIGVVGTGIQFIESAVDAIWGPQNRREAELYTAAMHNANKALREATGLLGEFGEMVKTSTQDQLKQEFQRRAGWLDSRISGAVDTPKFTTNETEFFYQLNMLQTAFSTTDSYLLWARQQEATFRELQAIETQIISQIEAQERRKMQAELDLRRTQGEIIIAEIERQRRNILAETENALTAQREAVIRMTRMQFDFVEMELRAKYMPQLMAAGNTDPVMRDFLKVNWMEDIDRLRRVEQSTLEGRLNDLSEAYHAEVDRANAYHDGLIGAIRTAMTDMSQDFAGAITTHTNAFLEQWNSGAAEPLNPFLSLPQDIQDAVNAGLAGFTPDWDFTGKVDWGTVPDPPGDGRYEWGDTPGAPGGGKYDWGTAPAGPIFDWDLNNKPTVVFDWNLGDRPTVIFNWNLKDNPQVDFNWNLDDKPEVNFNWQLSQRPSVNFNWQLSQQPTVAFDWKLNDRPSVVFDWNKGAMPTVPSFEWGNPPSPTIKVQVETTVRGSGGSGGGGTPSTTPSGASTDIAEAIADYFDSYLDLSNPDQREARLSDLNSIMESIIEAITGNTDLRAALLQAIRDEINS